MEGGEGGKEVEEKKMRGREREEVTALGPLNYKNVLEY